MWAAALLCAITALVPGRAAAETIDGQYNGGGRLTDLAMLELPVLGRGGVPASGVEAVVLNVTGIDATRGTFFTVWPAGEQLPNASTLNLYAGETRPNLAIAKVGAGGKVKLYANIAATHAVVDVQGYFPTGTVNSLTPARLLDTRPEGVTIDSAQAKTGAVPPRGTIQLQVTGRGGVPTSGVGAVALNVTGTRGSADTFITVWPTGVTRPLASNLNLQADQIAPNMVIVPVGADGRVQLYNEAGSTHLIADVLAWFPTANSSYTGLTPARLLDTRPGGQTADGLHAASGALTAGGSINVPVTGRGGVPASGVGAVAVNVTATASNAPSFLTVWPTGEPQPLASNLNFTAGQTIPNVVTAKVGAGGQISIYNDAGAAHVIVDILGWFPASGGYQPLNPARLLDTRQDVAIRVTDDGSLLGIPLGTDAATTLDQLARRLGPVTEYRDWISACSLIPNNPAQISWARWGMLEVVLYRTTTQPARLYGWKLREDLPPGRITPVNIELPGGYPWRTNLITLTQRINKGDLRIVSENGPGGVLGAGVGRGEWFVGDRLGPNKLPGDIVSARVGNDVVCE